MPLLAVSNCWHEPCGCDRQEFEWNECCQGFHLVVVVVVVDDIVIVSVWSFLFKVS